MKIEKKINAFYKLGRFLAQFDALEERNKDLEQLNNLFHDRFQQLIKTHYKYNGWFTENNVRFSIASIGKILEERALEKWISKYKKDIEQKKDSKKVAVIMAGNIPLVGFHDFLCVLMAGHQFIGKLSSSDQHLLPLIAEVLTEIEPELKTAIYFEYNQLKDIDALIATGSNNSARYFEYYFEKYPHIIRKNRNTVAILDGTETENDLKKIGKDIFQYFGLGCRNVSKIFVPEGYIVDDFFKSIYDYKEIINNNKYANNYNYNRTIYLMSSIKFLDNGFLLLKEDTGLASPVAVLYYEHYKNEKSIKNRLNADEAAIQCVVSKNKVLNNTVDFGEAQHPDISDYADGVDTMKFLLQQSN